jgi:hypothetical protein
MASSMTTYNTGAPVPSVDVRDLYDNAENLDNFSNGPAAYYADRRGVSRQSLAGIRAASQYTNIGAYAAGLVFTSYNQTFSYLGNFYAPSAGIALPYTTTGAGAGEIATFRNVGDALLRAELATPSGSTLVNHEGQTLQARLDEMRSVKDAPFSATGAGVVNDSTAFQSANDSITSGQSGAFYVPKGTYKLDSNVVPNSRTVTFLCAAGVVFTGVGVLKTNFQLLTSTGSNNSKTRHKYGGNLNAGGLQVGGGDPWEGGEGVTLSNDGHANWLKLQTSINYNPTELVIYGASGQGRAISVLSTGFIDRTEGTNFDSAWIGKAFYFNYKKYEVKSFVSVNRIELQEVGGAAVSFVSASISAFHFILTTGAGLCSVTGTTVTRISGQPFVPFFATPGFSFKIGGVSRTVVGFTSGDVMTLSAAPGDTASAAYEYSLDINGQVSTVRVQKQFGTTEENLTISARASGEYEIRSGQAGNGEYYPIKFYNGQISAFNPRPVMQVNQSGRFGVSNSTSFAPSALAHFSGNRTEGLGSGLYNEVTRTGTQWSDGERSLETGTFSNGTQGGYLQGRDSANNPYDVCLNPRGGNVGVGLNAAAMKLTVAGVVGPGADNTYSLGQSGARWSVVWAATGTINTSDERTKADIKSSALGLNFIKKLRPVSYRFKSGGSVSTEVQDGFDDVEIQATEPVDVETEYSEVVEIGGRKTLVTKKVVAREERPIFDILDDVYSVDGIKLPATSVARMVKVRVPKTKQVVTAVAGKRTHYGLIAQEVKHVIDAAGVDFAGYVEGDDGLLGLRYEQFIAPLIRAVQELSAKVDALSKK